jgi:hypothetical protein
MIDLTMLARSELEHSGICHPMPTPPTFSTTQHIQLVNFYIIRRRGATAAAAAVCTLATHRKISRARVSRHKWAATEEEKVPLVKLEAENKSTWAVV